MAVEVAQIARSSNRGWLETDKFDIHGWEIMDSFSRSIEDADVRDELLYPIRGVGRVSVFRHTIPARD
jgi:hypothetical protein